METTPATPVTDLTESSVINDSIIVFALPQNPSLLIFSRFHLPEQILWPGDDAGDAGDRLEGELGHQRLHHRVQRASKPLRINFKPILPT